MKIAVVTEDGQTLSQHFGRAPYYLVFTVENGQVIHKELRDKAGHTQFANQIHLHEPGAQHGQGHHSEQRHRQMAETIADCEAVLCQGMGQGAYDSLSALGIRPVVTDLASVDEAAAAYIAGTIRDHPELLH
jgi:predicted Fe-Mo cluster-binding NifX family protein